MKKGSFLWIVIAAAILAFFLLAAQQRLGSSRKLLAQDEPSFAFLPIILAPKPPVDMNRYMIGDGRLYEVRHSGGSQARHQSQTEDKRSYQTKGNDFFAEWEEMWPSQNSMFRGTDTSPGSGQYYTLYEDGMYGSSWSPRFWKVGDIYERNPYVVFYNKSNCSIAASGFHHRTWLRFDAYYDQYTFVSGITLNNVIQLAWLLDPGGQPVENYFYAEDYGLVGWGSSDRGFSHISEIHAPGTRPDNKRELIPCLDSSNHPLKLSSELNFGPLPEPFASRVK